MSLRTAQRNNRDTREQSADADVASAYNEFWWDRAYMRHGSTAACARRSSSSRPTAGFRRCPPAARGPPPPAPRRAADAGRQTVPRIARSPERCLLFNAGPPLLPGPYNNNLQIVQTARLT